MMLEFLSVGCAKQSFIFEHNYMSLKIKKQVACRALRRAAYQKLSGEKILSPNQIRKIKRNNYNNFLGALYNFPIQTSLSIIAKG